MCALFLSQVVGGRQWALCYRLRDSRYARNGSKSLEVHLISTVFQNPWCKFGFST